MDLCGVVSGVGKLFNVQEGKWYVQEENKKMSKIVVSLSIIKISRNLVNS